MAAVFRGADGDAEDGRRMTMTPASAPQTASAGAGIPREGATHRAGSARLRIARDESQQRRQLAAARARPGCTIGGAPRRCG
jgi:hypothetical protein